MWRVVTLGRGWMDWADLRDLRNRTMPKPTANETTAARERADAIRHGIDAAASR
jgi:hypothetical protein